MTKNEVIFEDWFDYLKEYLGDRGIFFNDADSVREDYDKGSDHFDVGEEIAAEYE